MITSIDLSVHKPIDGAMSAAESFLPDHLLYALEEARIALYEQPNTITTLEEETALWDWLCNTVPLYQNATTSLAELTAVLLTGGHDGVALGLFPVKPYTNSNA